MQTSIRTTGICLTLLLLWVVSAGASERRLTPLVKAVKRVENAVVNIHTQKYQRQKESLLSPGKGRKVNGMGTGIIIDERGYIVTNEHVIHNVDNKNINVELLDKSIYKARLISYDLSNDLAIVKIDAGRPLQVAPLGTSSDVMHGESVFAIGNAFGYTHTITVGIVSALGRNVDVNDKISYSDLIQTDAAINPGNSGGPLVNLDGDVIGINVAIRANAQKIGFAIPIDQARGIMARLLNSERLGGTYHGLVTHDVKSPGVLKAIVDATQSDSPAAKAGFRSGDEILKAGKVNVADRADLERSLLGLSAGSSITITVRRDGKEESLKLTLEKRSDRIAASDTTVVHVNNSAARPGSVNQRLWHILGLKLTPVSIAHVQAYDPRLHGGLLVTGVRNGSPASTDGIHRGDILFAVADPEDPAGFREMTKVEHFTWLFTHPGFSPIAALKYHAIRGRTRIEGAFKLSR